LLHKRPDYYLDELARKVTKHQQKHLLGNSNDLSVSVYTICRALKKLGYTHKQVSNFLKIYLCFLKINIYIININSFPKEHKKEMKVNVVYIELEWKNFQGNN